MNASTIGLADESSPDSVPVEDAEPSAPAAEGSGQTSSPEAPEAQVESTTATEPAGAPPVAATEPFIFGGKTFDSREAAEQSFRSWEGRITAEQEKGREYEKRINDYWDYIQAVSKENDDLRSQFESKIAEAEKKEEKPTYDFDKIGRMMKLAASQGMDPTEIGLRQLAEQMEKVFENKVSERLASVEKPITEMQESAAELEADKNMFLWAQSLKDSSGAPAYPEFQREALNEPLATNTFRVWKELAREFGPKYAYSAPGFDYAYRLAYDLTPQPAPSPQTRARDDQGRFVPMNPAAAAASDITGNNPNPTKPKSDKTSAQEMFEELTAHKPLKIGETELGFFE